MFFFLLLLCSIFCHTTALNTPILTQVIFRHGERAPNNYVYFPTDPPEIRMELPDELGELTIKGIQEAYEFGQQLKSMYGYILSRPYRPSELRVLAGADNSTIDTATAILAAFLSLNLNSSQGNWKEELNWRPVPVHTDELLDWASFDALAKCPPFNDVIVSSKIYKNQMKKYATLMGYLESVTGIKIEGIIDIVDIVDNLLIRSKLGLPMPEWDNGTWSETATDVFKDMSQILFRDPWARKFTGGWLFLQIINAMEYRIKNRANHRLILYSAHDTSIILLGRMLGLSKITMPEFASHMTVELYNHSNVYEVKLKYSANKGEEAEILNIPACPAHCTYETFITLAPTISTREIYGFCSDFHPVHTVYRILGSGDDTIIITLGIIVIVVTIVLLTMCCATRFYATQVNSLIKSEREARMAKRHYKD